MVMCSLCRQSYAPERAHADLSGGTCPGIGLEKPNTSLLGRLGLDRHDVSYLAYKFYIKHSPICRSINGKGMGYHCICDFFTHIVCAAWRVFDD